MEMDSGRRRRLFMMILGIVLALAAGWATFMLGSQREPAAAEVEKQPVLVAAQEIPARTTVTADHFVVRELPVEGVLSSAYADANQVVGRVNSVPIYTEQQITPNLFATTAADVPFEIMPADEVITDASPLWRAVSLRIPNERAVGGEVKAGQRVDVIVSVEFAGGASVPVVDETTGRVIFEETDGAVAIVHPETGEIIGVTDGVSTKLTVQDVEVLKADPENELYVLKVDMHEAEQIAHVTQVGPDAVSLALRPGQDTRRVSTDDYGETTDRIIMRYLYRVPQLTDLEELLGFPIEPVPGDDSPGSGAPPQPGESPTPEPEPGETPEATPEP